jgi:hypothetical protein
MWQRAARRAVAQRRCGCLAFTARPALRSTVQQCKAVGAPALSTRFLSSSTTDRAEGARRLAAAETDVLAALAEVQDSILSEGVVQLGMVQELFVNLESE